jgi:N-terminal acetyltransferase B complex non-catalytic subunit
LQALAVLTIETLRFKPSSIGKMYKLGSVRVGALPPSLASGFLPMLQMVQSIKDIRAQAIAVLKTMSNELVSWAEQEGTEEKRSAFVSACHQLPSTSVSPFS